MLTKSMLKPISLYFIAMFPLLKTTIAVCIMLMLAMLFTILKNNATNIFRNVPDAVYRDIRKGVIRCILATDMAKHGEIMGSFRRYLESFNYDDPEHKSLVYS